MNNNKDTHIYIAKKIAFALDSVVNNKEGSSLEDINSLLKSQTLDKLELLKYLGNFLKITPENIDRILFHSTFFTELYDSCLFYSNLIDDIEIKQQNFINMFILNHILKNLTLENINLFCIYSNLFLVDFDQTSFYQIVKKSLQGLPKSLYEIALFLKEWNNINDQKEIIRKCFDKNCIINDLYNNWELTTFFNYLYKLDLIEKIDIFYYYEYQYTTKMNELIFDNKSFYERLKNKDVSDSLFKSILNDDINTFIHILNHYQINVDKTIKKPDDIRNKKINMVVNDIIYWPFGSKKEVSLIKIAAFSNSIKIFKYLVSNQANFENELINYAICGGNNEIIHICQNNGCLIDFKSFEMAIRYFHTDIFIWLYDNNYSIIEDKMNDIAIYIIKYSNPEIFLELYNRDFNFSQILLSTFHFIEREWIKLLIETNSIDYYFDFQNKYCIQTIFANDNLETFKALFEELNGKIDISFDTLYQNFGIHVKEYHYHFDKIVERINERLSPLRTFEFYFEQKGELDKYKNELIFPPIPNEISLVFLRKVNPISIFIKSKFLIYLCHQKAFDFFNCLSLSDICEYTFKTGDFTFIEKVEKYLPEIKEIATYKIFDKDWKSFILKNKEVKQYFFKVCNDDESQIDFYTQGLLYASFYDDDLTVKCLLEKKYIDVNSNEFKLQSTALNLASECNFTKIIYYLINDERVDVNALSHEQKSSFYIACEYNYVEAVDLFLKNSRVDINLPNIEGKTPLYIACELGHEKIVKKILNKTGLKLNVLINNKSEFGIAVTNWHYKIIEILMNDERIKYQNENEENPLIVACSKCNLKIVKLLFSIDSINKYVTDEISFLAYLKVFSF